MSVSEPAQYQSPGASSPKWNADVINVIDPPCVFPALTFQNVCRAKGRLFRRLSRALPDRWEKSEHRPWQMLVFFPV